jgi:hypothetical protein
MPLMSEEAFRLIPQEHRKAFRQTFSRPENFLKHADQDPNDVLPFDSRGAEFLMAESSAKYQEITGGLIREFLTFLAWFEMQNPETVVPPERAEEARKFGQMFGSERGAFYIEAMEAYEQLVREHARSRDRDPNTDTDTDTDTQNGND